MNFTFITDLMNLEPAKRYMGISILLLSGMITFLYNDNLNYKQEKIEFQKKCDDAVFEAQKTYLVQLDNNRKIQQEQLNKFYIESNEERDSIYRFFDKKIKVLQKRINSGIKDLNEIKNENIH